MDKREKTIYALGFFDGVHLAHQALLRRCRLLAAEGGFRTGTVTFDGHPDALVTGSAPKLINTVEDRACLLREAGIDRIVTLPFDRALMETPWQDFFHLLRERYGAAGLVCGHNFRFGKRGAGTPALLQEACRCAGMICDVVPEQKLDGIPVSSTYIRGLLAQGQMERAAQFLGRMHRLTGVVVRGRQFGRTMGLPTANIPFPAALVQPRSGVYACRATVEGKAYPAVTNVGSRPTVGGADVNAESYLLDFSGDLYGKKLTLEFFTFLRPEEKFPTVSDLQREIRKNAAQARKLLENA